MSKATIALGSFIAGACSMFMFLQSHTFMLVQPAFSQTVGRPFVYEKAKPVVPPLVGISFKDSSFSGEIQQLDGLDCENCIFHTLDATTHNSSST